MAKTTQLEHPVTISALSHHSTTSRRKVLSNIPLRLCEKVSGIISQICIIDPCSFPVENDTTMEEVSPIGPPATMALPNMDVSLAELAESLGIIHQQIAQSNAALPDMDVSHAELAESWAKILQQIAQSNPPRLDLTQVPAPEDFRQLSYFHRKVYNNYFRHTTFELDMVHCTSGCFSPQEGNQKIFYPVHLPESHKESIRKLALRFMLKDYENKCPNPDGYPQTLGRLERNWMKRTLENIPSFTKLVSLNLNMTFDHDSPKTLEWDEDGNCHWPEFKQTLNYCLDRLMKLNRLRVSMIGTSVTLIKWLEARYGFPPKVHQHDKYCHNCEFSSEIGIKMPEATVYEWRALPDFSLEFEKEENEDEFDGIDWEDEYVEIVLPKEDVQERLSLEGMIEETEMELFGPRGVDRVVGIYPPPGGKRLNWDEKDAGIKWKPE